MQNLTAVNFLGRFGLRSLFLFDCLYYNYYKYINAFKNTALKGANFDDRGEDGQTIGKGYKMRKWAVFMRLTAKQRFFTCLLLFI